MSTRAGSTRALAVVSAGLTTSVSSAAMNDASASS